MFGVRIRAVIDRGQLVEHEPHVLVPFRDLGGELRDSLGHREDPVRDESVGKLDLGVPVGVVDGRHQVAVAGQVLHQRRVEAAVPPEGGEYKITGRPPDRRSTGAPSCAAVCGTTTESAGMPRLCSSDAHAPASMYGAAG